MVIDFTAPHTMLSGTVNAVIGTIAVGLAARAATSTGIVDPVTAAVVIVGATAIGIIGTMAWSAGAVPPRAVVAYRFGAWLAACVWCLTMTVDPVITIRDVAIRLTALCGAAAVAALATSALASAGNDHGDQAPATTAGGLRLLPRDALAAEWIDRIRRVCRVDVDVPAIEDVTTIIDHGDGRGDVETKIGYIVQIELPEGGVSWEVIHRAEPRIAADMALGPGCGVTATMGRHRRVALATVTTVDVLGISRMYPVRREARTITEPIRMMVGRDGSVRGPNLRHENVLIAGPPGGGKSNALKVLMSDVALCSDALLCVIDTTGPRAASALLDDYIHGRVDKPPVWWCAYSEAETLIMLRALSRAAVARNTFYSGLKFAANDDKMPISPDHPAFVIAVDETAHVAGSKADPAIRELITEMVKDHRDPGIRVAFSALRGTNDVILQSVQSQCHTIMSFKTTGRGEYVSLFGGEATTIDNSDAPYPGCAFVKLWGEPGIAPYYVWRTDPGRSREVAAVAAATQPDVDEITWLALNGRGPNGDPLPGVAPSDVDACSARWDRYRRDCMASARPASDHQQQSRTAAGRAPARSLDECLADIDRIRNEARAVRPGAGARQLQGDAGNGPAEPLDARTEQEIDRAISEILGREEMPVADAPENRSMARNELNARIIEIIRAAGGDGISVTGVQAELRKDGITCDRTTMYKWIGAIADAPMPEIQKRSDIPGGRCGRWYHIDHA